MLKRTLGILLAIVVLVPALGETGSPKSGGTLKYGMLRDPVGWEPHINQGWTTYTFMNSIYETLIRYSLKGDLEPGLATRWETPDPATYILHLRKGIKFHSGNPFTAEDVKYSLERILDPKTAATRAREFSVVQSIAVVDPYTVKIALKNPSALFLELLASGEAVIVDKKWAEAGGNFKQQ
ncbi:MAG: ABC transporter substrate-binding protein, partial [Zetaproteobacteria bacterium]